MSTVRPIPPIKERKRFSWQTYLLDSILAIIGTLLVTAGIFIWKLYPHIPNISIVYLLVVIGLASTRGRYAAILSALLAFLSFDYFIVPPLFTFVMYRPEEWIALFVFLIDAILTGQLAALLRQRADDASRRERETHLLYDLVRMANREEQPERELQSIAQAIVDVFSSWGVHDCAILQPDATGTLQVQASAYQPTEEVMLSSDEKSLASLVMAQGRSMGLYDDATLKHSSSAHLLKRVVVQSTSAGRTVRRTTRAGSPDKMRSQNNPIPPMYGYPFSGRFSIKPLRLLNRYACAARICESKSCNEPMLCGRPCCPRFHTICGHHSPL